MFGLSKISLYAIAGALLLSGYLWWHHSVYQDGYDTGNADKQAEFDQYRAKLSAITQQRKADNAIKAAQVKANNEATLNGYQESLAAYAADNTKLSHLLHDRAARSCSAILPPADDRQGTSSASTQPSSQAEIDRYLDELDLACRQDSAQLNALIAELAPHLP